MPSQKGVQPHFDSGCEGAHQEGADRGSEVSGKLGAELGLEGGAEL